MFSFLYVISIARIVDLLIYVLLTKGEIYRDHDRSSVTSRSLHELNLDQLLSLDHEAG